MANNKLFGMESAYILLLVLIVSALCLPAAVSAYAGESVLKYQTSSSDFVVSGKSGGSITLSYNQGSTDPWSDITDNPYVLIFGIITFLLIILLCVMSSNHKKERREWERREWERREWERRNNGRHEWDNRNMNSQEWWESNDRDRRQLR